MILGIAARGADCTTIGVTPNTDGGILRICNAFYDDRQVAYKNYRENAAQHRSDNEQNSF